MRLFLFLLITFTHTALKAQKGEIVLENSLLWEVSGNGLATPSYLFGTTHFICRDDALVPDKALSKFMRSGTLYLEVEVDLPSDSPRYEYLQGTSLKDLVGKSYYKKIIQITSSRFPNYEDTLNRLQPWLVQYRVKASVVDCPTTSIDNVLLQLAKKNNKPIKGLETSQVHYSLNGVTSLKKQVMNLKASVDYRERIETTLHQQTAIYKKQDITTMYIRSAYDRNGFRKDDSKQLLDARNQQWIPIMEEAMRSQTVFFAFGAAHLAGTNGIIHLLRKNGYRVTPITD
jgi:uncharacterized protein YbaP (TraB family)